MEKHLFKHKFLLISKFTWGLMETIVSLVAAFFMGYIVDCIVDKDLKKLMWGIAILITLMLVQFIVIYMYRYLEGKFIKASIKDLKDVVFDSVINYDVKRFNSESTASYISNLTTDMDIISKKYYRSVFEIFENLTLLIGGVAYMIFIHPLMAAIVVGMGLFMLLIPTFMGKALGRKQKSYSDSMEEFRTITQDNLSGFEVIKSFNIGSMVFHKFFNANKKSEKAKMKYNNTTQVLDSSCEFLNSLIQTGLTGVGIFLVLKGKMTLGVCISAIQLMNYILQPMSSLSRNISMFKSVKPIIAKLDGLLRKGTKEHKNYEELQGFEKSIEFQDVCFSYTEERKILDGISLKINKGEKCAIVGGSGCGKSTLIKLLLGFYDDYTGTITIDGKDVKDISPSSLYQYICPIEQKVYMMQDTIENNIKLYKEYSPEAVQYAIDNTGLSDLIGSLDQGIKTLVTEDASNFSGGESQRISIARALVKHTPVLILDEATSSLDNINAYNIEKSLMSIKDLTCVEVTHKFNKDILRRYDKVIVLKDGKVVEIGTFDELIDRKQYFYSLYNVTANDVHTQQCAG
ncbi:ATP-binding cassette, subfamily C [Hathewaya proteolytica DSM 3090]|uniref:ATP-binding cassette, subfamily C n=1 Tax=Hathewaya proteolytica DSM 3090 TaxID=1121331 RepID=A0A1M6SP20_9CLOT|nr:ABC transporter ATP-binding protein [Hathewaya proteolytica]SHK46492.1 ATP-binding cassette, subfamily C [Hathewaya proteolytica DSM 3090]